jgi:hypothetical protein
MEAAAGEPAPAKTASRSSMEPAPGKTPTMKTTTAEAAAMKTAPAAMKAAAASKTSAAEAAPHDVLSGDHRRQCCDDYRPKGRTFHGIILRSKCHLLVDSNGVY